MFASFRGFFNSGPGRSRRRSDIVALNTKEPTLAKVTNENLTSIGAEAPSGGGIVSRIKRLGRTLRPLTQVPKAPKTFNSERRLNLQHNTGEVSGGKETAQQPPTARARHSGPEITIERLRDTQANGRTIFGSTAPRKSKPVQKLSDGTAIHPKKLAAERFSIQEATTAIRAKATLIDSSKTPADRSTSEHPSPSSRDERAPLHPRTRSPSNIR